MAYTKTKSQSSNTHFYNYQPYFSPMFLFSAEFNEDRSKHKSEGKKNQTVRILLADDDIDDRELFQEAMSETGFPLDVQLAEDGSRLIELLKAEKKLPDIIFLDLNMPNKNGKECLVEIRKNSYYNHIPIVIYSTSSSNRDIDETFENGANLYVRKPSSFNELLLITKNVLLLDWDLYKPKSCRHNYVFSFGGK
jgi:CheY-like chemotaxis protein